MGSLLGKRFTARDPAGATVTDVREAPANLLLAEALNRLQSVAEVGHLLLASDNRREVYHDTVAIACEKMQAKIGLFFVHELQQDLLVLAASVGLDDLPEGPPPTLSLGSGLSGWVAERRQALIVNDIERDGRFGSMSALRYRRLSAVSVPICFRDELLGVLTVCDDQPDKFGLADLATCQAMAASLALGLRCQALRDENQRHYLATIQSLVNALEAKDSGTQGHSLRIAHFCREVGRVIGLSKDDQGRLEIAARLHDIGKIGLPEQVLNKAGALTEQEWVLVRQHPVTGARIVRGVPYLDEVARIIEAHHEAFDGSGYPNALTREEIPVESRIIAVADAFDAMVTTRPYRAAMTPPRAIAELDRCSGSQFDPRLVTAFSTVVTSKSFAHFYEKAPAGSDALGWRAAARGNSE